MLTALAGGVGAAKLLYGISEVTREEVRIIVNTADDDVIYGLYISPDIDTVIYTLSGMADNEKGWGISNDTFSCLSLLSRLGMQTWFKIGDRDFAMHIFRTFKMRYENVPLSRVTSMVAERLGVRQVIIPMSDQQVRTVIDTGTELLPFQRYFVERGASTEIKGVIYTGIEAAEPAPGVLESIIEARTVLIPPSNPVVSIGPIIAVKGIREALRSTDASVVAVSPIVGGRALKGPADKMLRALNLDVSPVGVASLYRDFLDVMIIDDVDASRKREIEEMGIRCYVTDTVMNDLEDRKRLARFVLSIIEDRG
ncbi:MAG: 2-phospho-L-lactate transferase [Aigarchaeota archaeon]|nr:2-phospho-L-lactate transferase [Aigarchaeota archaeon]MDW8092867.1 2-phospho-L-lactate transferase [Nitrososphaerota archaeon]